MIEYLIIGGGVMLLGGLARALTRPARRPVEYEYMTLEQAQAVCTPSRGRTLTGMYSGQADYYGGAASEGGYMAGGYQVEIQPARGHDSYWENRPYPQVERQRPEVGQTWNIYERGPEHEDWQPETNIEHVQVIPGRHDVTREFEQLGRREWEPSPAERDRGSW